jgi:hypothetical protein
MTDLPPREGNIPPQIPDAELELPDAPGWPKPVGLTSVILGALNLMCTGCGGLWMVLLPTLMFEGMQQQYPDGVPDIFGSIHIPFMFSIGVGFLLEILLIVAGSMLLLRRAVARPLHLAYFVGGVIGFGISTWIGVQYQVEITEWIKQNPNTKFAQDQQASGWIGQTIGWTWGILMGLVWPVFCGVWFGLIKKKGSDITAGRAEVM